MVISGSGSKAVRAVVPAFGQHTAAAGAAGGAGSASMALRIIIPCGPS
ncbi:hypothetical protein ACU4GD_25415 [Cupriavidus basilensis]